MRSNSTKIMIGVFTGLVAGALLAAPPAPPARAPGSSAPASDSSPNSAPISQAELARQALLAGPRPPASPAESRRTNAESAVYALNSRHANDPRSASGLPKDGRTYAESALQALNTRHSEAPSPRSGAAHPPRSGTSPARQASLSRVTNSDHAVRALSGGGGSSSPDPIGRPASGNFPTLPPDPAASDQPTLPDLHSELFNHGGSYLYTPEGDRLGQDQSQHHEPLRLPEDWVAPEPFTLFSEFLGEGPINPGDHLRWFNGPYIWHPQFVGYGSAQMFGAAFQQNGQRVDLLGLQLAVELDLRLTGTERFHVQFRPVGEGGSGGSYYSFSDPEGYVDNSTGVPQRYWFEGELHSLLGPLAHPFAPNDINVVVGKFPFFLHNNLLMNDEIVGIAISKNSLIVGDLSNLNAQLLYAFDDVDTFVDGDSQLVGVHLSADWDRVFYEATLATVSKNNDADRDSHFAAISRTQIVGPFTFAGRALFKWGDEGGIGSGELFVLESNFGRYFDHGPLGVESAVLYCNGFAASQGWNSIGGGNYNRLRAAFEVNPLVRLSAGIGPVDTVGVALGVQLFRHHKDESISPEFAYEAPGGDSVFGFGVRYQRKVSTRSFIEVLGLGNYSDNPLFERDGVFASYTLMF